MKIVCPQCQTAYDVMPAALGSQGRQVRCARCKALWAAEPPGLAANVIPLGARATVPSTPAEFTLPMEAADPTPAAELIPAMMNEPAEPGQAPAGPPPEGIPAGEEAPSPAATDAAPDATIAAAVLSAPAAKAATADTVDIESAAAVHPPEMPRRVKRPAKPIWRSHALGAAIFLLMALNIALILGREQVVRVLPQTASLFETIGLPVNLRNLAFREIKTTEELHDGVTILLIEGKIVATGHKPADVPRLRFSIGAANGHEIYAWTALPTRTRLAPGEALPFRTRLASPPEQGRFVKVRFFTRHDLAFGLR
jgi:predicted Zn finger-like uncharacterized protein